MVFFTRLGEEVPFTASPVDIVAHGREIFERCAAGEFGEVAEYVAPPAPTIEQLAFVAKLTRAKLLSDSDWTQLPDVPTATKELWATYRQALRDITLQAEFPTVINWPSAPTQ